MKNFYQLFAFPVIFCMGVFSSAMAINVQGTALLEFQEDHQGIEVNFERIAPTYLNTLALTDSLGYYSAELEPGIYSITMSKTDFLPVTLPDMPIYADQLIDTVILETLGLSGQLSGDLGPGIFKIGGNISVASNATLRILPGTEFRFMQDITFEVYGTLQADGNATDSIRFTRFVEGGTWKGIDFKENSSSDSYLKYSIVEYSDDRGISVYKCSPLISHCQIRFNYIYSTSSGQDEDAGGGAGICLKYSNSLVEHTVVANNTGQAFGIGIYASDGSPKLSNSLIINNTSDGYPYNSGYGGGVFSSFGVNMIVENCVIAGNSSSVGGGICVAGTWQAIYIAEVRVFNSIIYGNLAGDLYNDGAAIESYGEVVFEITNSVVFGNVQNNFDDEYQWLGVNVTVNQNLDSCDAYGNIVMDPMFVNPATGDYHLSPGSPAIDAGDNLIVTAVTDLENNQRIWDGNNDNESVVDIGCYEFESIPVNNHNLLINRPDQLSFTPNPANGLLRVDNDGIHDAVIMDLSGKVLLSFFGNKADVSSLKPGCYLLKAQLSNGQFKTGKFIIAL
jgi:hypothetical protein